MPRATDRRIDKLIHLLVTNATVVVPGPKIASDIGVTRSTVWKWIEELRSLGVEIKGHPSSGYQLQKLPDLLVPSLVRRELGDAEIGHKVIHYFRIGSTNDWRWPRLTRAVRLTAPWSWQRSRRQDAAASDGPGTRKNRAAFTLL
ncbi:MAG: hypothetical protein DMG27_17215 [Acidobacteria bacterium]|nr:MAG: hypothetical protein DMG27_17215 [Acidobacteriota bacterium]